MTLAHLGIPSSIRCVVGAGLIALLGAWTSVASAAPQGAQVQRPAGPRARQGMNVQGQLYHGSGGDRVFVPSKNPSRAMHISPSGDVRWTRSSAVTGKLVGARGQQASLAVRPDREKAVLSHAGGGKAAGSPSSRVRRRRPFTRKVPVECAGRRPRPPAPGQPLQGAERLAVLFPDATDKQGRPRPRATRLPDRARRQEPTSLRSAAVKFGGTSGSRPTSSSPSEGRRVLTSSSSYFHIKEGSATPVTSKQASAVLRSTGGPPGRP